MTKYGFVIRDAAALVLVGGLSACGGGGNGALVIHPSLDSRFGCALETPMRITETAGGTADWNFARFHTFLAGREVERNEIGSDVIRNAGYGRVAASSNQTVTALFRINSDVSLIPLFAPPDGSLRAGH
jgi:hypothetical protein